MARTYDHIIGPREGHAHQHVRTAEDYLALQAKYLAQHRAAGVDVAVPHEATLEELATASAAYITFGQWKLDCACGNAPSVSVDWDLACCLECGAIYRGGLWFPEDRILIEEALLRRALRRNRNWRWPETLAFLLAENAQFGAVIQ